MKHKFLLTNYPVFHFVKINILSALVLFTGKVFAQYEKNPLLEITNDGYQMVVEKFVRIPDDNGQRPRINCITYMNNRLFASVELDGRIYEIQDNGNGTYSPELFFDVKQAILDNTGRHLASVSGSYHSGLRSVAFHPDFLSNGKFYTAVMEERPADTTGHYYLSDTEDHIDADGVLIEWTYDFDAVAVDENSYRELFRVAVPQFDHPIKQIAFDRYAQPGDPDYGLLYLGHGDGNLYNMPVAGGQNNDGRGKIIRINPLETDSSRYSIPPDNPFVNDTSWLDEIYATGFRNPHSLCFAKDDSDHVYLISSNAGRDNIEEVNVIYPGENYGWTPREGTYVQLPAGGLNSGIEALPDTEAQNGYTFPAAQWSHGAPIFEDYGGKCIVGGYIYTIEETGEKIYLSADFPESGIIMYNDLNELTHQVTKLDPDNPAIDEPEELTQTPFKILNVYFDDDNDMEIPPVQKEWMLDVINDEPSYDGSGRSDLRFGQDMDNNIYISSKRNGWIYKIESITPEEPDAISGNYMQDETALIVYPNPVLRSGSLHVSFRHKIENSATFNLISPDGKQVYSGIIQPGIVKYIIDMNSLGVKPGYYLAEISSASFNSVIGIIIQ